MKPISEQLFTNYSIAYIINLMNHWHINRVFLSIGKVTDLVKVSDFMALAAQNNIQVYRLIGENSYAKTDDGFNDLQIALQDAKTWDLPGYISILNLTLLMIIKPM